MSCTYQKMSFRENGKGSKQPMPSESYKPVWLGKQKLSSSKIIAWTYIQQYCWNTNERLY